MKSMLDLAYEKISLSKSGVPFNKLYDDIASTLGLSQEEKDDKIGVFYTDLSLDGRFIVLDDNVWDLRERYSFDNIHINVDDVYTTVESEEQDAEEKKEELEYDASVQGKDINEIEEKEDKPEGEEGETSDNSEI